MAKHLTEEMTNRGHSPVEGSKGGACLWAHGTNVPHQEGNSCSYRWQAHLRAFDDKETIYHLYKTAKIMKTFEVGRDSKKTGRCVPSNYFRSMKRPNIDNRDWDVDGPEEAIKRPPQKPVEAGKNFHHDTWPYWNNAHHIIPKGTLIAQIREQCRTKVKIKFVQVGLLAAKYNVNEKINMMMMPMDKEVAKILRVPRHLQLRTEDGKNTDGQSADCCNHKRYNAAVARRLKAIIDRYVEAYDKHKIEKKKHPTAPPPELSKAELEDLSTELYELILLSRGAGSLDGAPEGLSLDAIFADS